MATALAYIHIEGDAVAIYKLAGIHRNYVEIKFDVVRKRRRGFFNFHAVMW